jgi:hypothetical protein
MRLIAAALVATFLFANLAFGQELRSPLIGAIRWDNWTKDSLHTKVIAETDRLPFFMVTEPDGDRKTLGGETNTVDAENAYGYAAGLDYWIFGYYIDTPRRGPTLMGDAQRINRALDAYLRLPDRRGMRFAIQLNWSVQPEEAEYLQNAVVRFLNDRDYLRLPDGTAPVFLFTMSQWRRQLGGDARVNSFFDRFVAEIKSRTGVTVKLIAVDGDLEALKANLVPRGPVAGGTTYAHAPPCCDTEYRYEACADSNRSFWRRAQQANVPLIPNVTLGWDWRPILRYPDQMFDRKITNPSWCARGGTNDWVSLVRDALKFSAEEKSSPLYGAVIYAWNELSEGGWLVPTRAEAVRRLEAMATATGRRRVAPDIVLRFPESADGYQWPCPPELSGSVASTKPTAEEAAEHPGPWFERACKAN